MSDPYRIIVDPQGTPIPEQPRPGRPSANPISSDRASADRATSDRSARRRATARTLTWVVLAVSAVGNTVSSLAGVPTAVHLGFGVISGLCVAMLVALRSRRRP